MSPIFLALAKVLAARHLVLCIGPELSRGGSLAGRRELALDCMKQLEEDPARTPAENEALRAEVEDLLTKNRIAEALQHLRRRMEPGAFNDLVASRFEPPELAVMPVFAALRTLSRDLQSILTVNLDHGLEEALGGTWNTTTHLHPGCLQQPLQILKLCGTLPLATTWRLTADSLHHGWVHDAETQRLFAGAVRTRFVVFLGFDPADELFTRLLELAALAHDDPNNPRHYCVAAQATALQRERYAAVGGMFEILPPATDLAAWLLALADAARVHRQQRETHPPARPQCPYPGLRPFTSEETAIFFGRDADLLPALRQFPQAQRGGRWLQVEGPSGVGKSSFVHAALLPAILKGLIGLRSAPERWLHATLRPGDAPLASLAALLATCLPDAGDASVILEQLTASHLGLSELLHARVPTDHGLLLVIDPFEELLTLGLSDQRAAIEQALVAALDLECPLYLITTLRSDFIAEFHRSMPRLSTLLNAGRQRYTLAPLAADQLRQAIERPAHEYQVTIEDGLMDRILKDVALLRNHGRSGERPLTALAQAVALRSPDTSLPLVAHVMRVLWHRRPDHQLTGRDYHEIGGVVGALSDSADALRDRLPPTCRAVAERMLVDLIEVNPYGAGSRRSRTRAELLALASPDEQGELALTLLTGGYEDPPHVRLVVASGDREGDRFDLVHDALIDGWTWLRDRLRAEYHDRVSRYDLARRTEEWIRHGEHPRDLPTGPMMTYLVEVSTTNADERRFQDALRRHARSRIDDEFNGLRVMLCQILPRLGREPGALQIRDEILDWLMVDDPAVLRELRNQLNDTLASIQNGRPLTHIDVSRDLEIAGLLTKFLHAAALTTDSRRALSTGVSLLGDLQQRANNLEEARGAFTKVVALCRQLLEKRPDDGETLHLLSAAHVKLGDLDRVSCDPAEARAQYALALELRLAALHGPVTPSEMQVAQWEVAFVELRVGDVLLELGDIDGAAHYYHAALERLVPCAAADASNHELNHDLAVAHERMASIAERRGAWSDAAPWHTQAVERHAAGCKARPDWRPYALAHAHALERRGLAAAQTGDQVTARSDLHDALTIREKLLENPKDLDIELRCTIADTRAALADLDLADARVADARERLATAVAEYKALFPVANADRELHLGLARWLIRLGDLERRSKQLVPALSHYEEACETIAHIVRLAPDNWALRRNLATTLEQIAETRAEQRDPAAATYYDAALLEWSHLKAARPVAPDARLDHLRCLISRAAFIHDPSAHEAAAAALQALALDPTCDGGELARLRQLLPAMPSASSPAPGRFRRIIRVLRGH